VILTENLSRDKIQKLLLWYTILTNHHT